MTIRIERSQAMSAGLVAVVILSAAVLIVMAIAAAYLLNPLALKWVVVTAGFSYATQVAALLTVYTESILVERIGQGLWALAILSGLVTIGLILL